jgi:tetratricopeptide (TPR) repeat protein
MSRGALDEAERWYRSAFAVLDAAGSDVGRPTLHNSFGILCLQWGDFEQAINEFQLAMDGQRRAGHLDRAARHQSNLALALTSTGRYSEAYAHYNETLAVHEAAGDQRWVADTLLNMARVTQAWGRTDETIDMLRRAERIYRHLDEPVGVATILGNLALTLIDAGQVESARPAVEEALALHREHGFAEGEAEALDVLGLYHCASGQPEAAIEPYRRSIELARSVGAVRCEAGALVGLANAELMLGALDDALAHAVDGRDLAARIDYRSELAKAELAIGRAHRAAGDLGAARAAFERSLAIHAEIGAAAGHEVQLELAELGPPGGVVPVEIPGG